MSKMTQKEFDELVAKKVAEKVAAKLEEVEVTEVPEEVAETELKAIEIDTEAITKSITDGFAEISKSMETKSEGPEVGLEPLEKDLKGGFKSLSHFAADVAKAKMSGYRNISKEFDAWDKFTKAAGSPSQNESDSEAGGTLIPTEFSQNLMLAVEQQNEFLPRATRVPMATNNVQIPYVNGFDESGGLVYGGIEWKWLDEEKTRTATNVKFGKIGLQLKKVAGLAYVSEELLEDSPMSMENILSNGFRDGLDFQMNKVMLRGSGVGQPLGVLNAPCKVSIAAESGQTSGIYFENVIKMYARSSNPAGSIWVANQDTLPALATMSLAVGTGGIPVFMPANGASGTPYNTLFGLPLVFSKHASSLNTEGDICLVDWSQYLVGMKSNANSSTFATSVHLKFDVDQTAFKITSRLDGQPWWKTSLTGPQSASTISPIITLATRS